MATSRALGTGVQVAVVEPAALAAAEDAVAAWLDEVERAASRFREDSHVCRVNAARGEPVSVSALCLRAVSVAIEVAEATDGLVDPTVGAALEALGYDRDFAAIDADGPLTAAPPAPGWRVIEVDEAAGTVRVPPGVHLDLGSSAKAWAADQAAAIAARIAGCGALVNLGGDLAVAGDAPPDGWQVRVTDDHAAAPDAPGQTVCLASGGLATSSASVRRWRRGGAEVHHIVDPRTGLPAGTPWRTVSVAAASCVAANGAATAAMIVGDGAPMWLTTRGLAARLVSREGLVRHLGSWPAEGEEP